MKDNFKQIADNYTFHHALGGGDQTGGLEQNKNEMLEFVQWMYDHNIKTFVEIGMAQGYFSKYLEEIGLEVTGITLDEKLLKYRPKTYFIGDSSTLDHMIDKVDLVFVDGDHSYTGVKSDYEKYRGKCKYMAFHDILGLRDCEGVKIAWQEIRGTDYKQFIDRGNREGASGIGVIESNYGKTWGVKAEKGSVTVTQKEAPKRRRRRK